MPESSQPIIFADSRGGLNSADPPHLVRENQVTAATNVEWYRASLARKRRGSRLVERTSGASTLPSNKTFSTMVGAPSLSDTAYGVVIEASDFSGWYGWGFGGSPTNFSAVGAADTPTTNACVVYFNGNYFAAYKSSVDRLHWLGKGSSSSYRVGIGAPSSPAVGIAAGAVTDTRKYRRVYYAVGGNNMRSEPSAETVGIVLAAGQATVNAPGAFSPPDFYTHWELQVASLALDNYATWWVAASGTSGTNLADNNASLLSLTPANELGLFTVPHSAKYLGVDVNRLLLAGAYENSSDEKLQQRVWFTPALGDRDEGDDVRIVDTTTQSNWLDIDGGDGGGALTGFGPATLGDVLVFKRTQLWRLVRTGIVATPYQPRAIDKTYGTFGYRTVCAGQDENGGPCVYFASARGPVRVGQNGPVYLGGPIEDIWARVNQYGSVHTSQHAVFHQDRGQYWLWVSVDGATVPSVLLVYTVATGAWSTYTGAIAAALCSALLPRYIQEANKGITTSPSVVLTAPRVPYCCPNTNGQIAECDAINPSTGVALDTDLETYSGSGSVWSDGTAFQASVTLPPLVKPCDGTVEVVEASVFADAASGVSVSVGLIPDYDSTKTRTASVSIAAAGSEARVMRRVDGAQMGEARAMQVSIGDASAVASQWTLHALQVRTKRGATR